MNRPLFRKVLDHIKANPAFFGFLWDAIDVIRETKLDLTKKVLVTSDVMDLLEISSKEFIWLDGRSCTIADFEAFYEKGGIPK